MPLNPADKAHRDNLVKAAQVLRDVQHPDLANSVDYVLSSNGVAFIKKIREASGGTPNLSIRIPGRLWDQLAPHEADGEFLDIIEQGFRSFLNGTFDARVQRQPRGAGPKPPYMLNVGPSGVLQAEVSKRCRELREQPGTGGRLTLSTVAALSLYQHYGIGPYGEDRTAAPRERTQVFLNADLKEAVSSSGLLTKEVATLVEGGLRRFVAGSFDLRLPDRAAQSKSGKGSQISLFLDSDLVQQARGRFEEVKAERDLPGHTAYTSVVSAVLAEHFQVGPYAPGAGA